MRLCYVDESGKTDGLTGADTSQQPVVVIAGVAFPEHRLIDITHDWIDLKRRFLPGMARYRGHRGWLDGILRELKGTSLRRGFRVRATNRQRTHALGLLDRAVDLIERHEGRLIGRIWVKQLGVPIKGMHLHRSSLQFICAGFHAGIPERERGVVVVDGQAYRHNDQLAHSVFTQRFATRPSHERLVDMPVFGHTDNRAGLQIADLVCSALLAPIACAVYADRYARRNAHCEPGFLALRDRYGERLGRLVYDWPNPKTGRVSSTLVVHDPIDRRPTRLMWSAEPAQSGLRAATSRL